VEERLTDLQQAVVLTPQQQESLDALRNEKGKKNLKRYISQKVQRL